MLVSLYGNLALQVEFECFGSADVPAVDEHLRRGHAARYRAQYFSADFVIEWYVDVIHLAVKQQLFSPSRSKGSRPLENTTIRSGHSASGATWFSHALTFTGFRHVGFH
jgi:hypothetical protein